MLKDLKHISVLNYNENCVYAYSAPNSSVKFEAAVDGCPTMTPLTLDEIKYLNNTNIFKSGLLEFQKDIEDEIYEELNIDVSKLLKNSDIREILLNPTKEGLIKIISINNLSDFDRVRAQFQKLKVDGYKLTLDIANIIGTRTHELLKGHFRTNIVIDDADVHSNVKVATLEKELAEMRALLDKALKSNAESIDEDSKTTNNETADKEVSLTKKSPGRPSKRVTK